jgi:truncated hemoglobin YjbI
MPRHVSRQRDRRPAEVQRPLDERRAQGNGITQAEFDALAADLRAVLESNKVPKAEVDEIMAIAASTAKDIVEKK